MRLTQKIKYFHIIFTLKIRAFFTKDKELNKINDYLKNNRLTYFNYSWFHEYNCEKEYPVLLDENDRFFIMYNNHRMYFKKQWSEQRIKEYLNNLLPEQDKRSPHLYFDTGEMREKYGVVVDGGVAEGLFALSILPKTEKIYLIEPDPEWVEALSLTFASDSDKVIILDKYLGTDDDQYSLNNVIASEGEVDLIKLDIEGYEINALRELGESIKHVKEMLVCVYHYQDEEKELRNFLSMIRECIVNIYVRPGYIYFLHDSKQKFPFLRHGVIRLEVHKYLK